MQKRNFKLALVAVWMIAVSGVFDFFGYEIDEFNSSVRLFLRSGKTDIRLFDEKGIPLSFSARSGEKFISPFYVIHYGLIYSEVTQGREERVGLHWREDSSVKYWNVNPSVVKEEYFRFAADWVVDNLVEFKGQKHLLYNFDWEYRNYPNGKLTAPWWSGLSDAYAIVLLLRAYDVYGEKKYFAAASDLYLSVLAPVTLGGSLLELNGLPWIEEYVDPNAAPGEMSKVLNGMVYAYYGINAFEKHSKGFGASGASLEKSIVKNFETFSLGRWSLYDSIGNAANIKYHRIHFGLLSDFVGEGRGSLDELLEKWAIGVRHSGFFWILNSNWSYAKLHFLFSWIFVLLFGVAAINRMLARRANAA